MENKHLTPGDGFVDVKLSRAIEISGVKTDTVRMREPTVADQEAAGNIQGTDATREIMTFANLCEIAPDEIRSMTMRDYKRLQSAYVTFID
jgi:uncharacterized phage protein gp47/JayE